MWPSTTKYFSPLCSYTVPPCRLILCRPDRVLPWPWLALRGRQVEAEVLGRVLGVGDHDGPVVGVDHAAVVRGHVLLELRLVEEAGVLAQRLGDLVVDDVHAADGVDPDHRRQRRHRHIGLGGHDLGDHRADLVVHQREPALVGRGVVGLERAFDGFERGHCASSFGASRLMSVRIPEKRLLHASRPSSNRGGLASGCDQIGCRVRAAAKSYSAAPMIVGVTKSPFRGAACCTRWLRNSSPTSGSKTTFPAKIASHQSSIPVSCSASSRTPCQAGSLFHASMCAVPFKPGTSSDSVRLYSARSWAARIRCMLFTEIALLCMFVGARRLAFANKYRPRPWSTCIQAPTWRATKSIQFV